MSRKTDTTVVARTVGMHQQSVDARFCLSIDLDDVILMTHAVRRNTVFHETPHQFAPRPL